MPEIREGPAGRAERRAGTGRFYRPSPAPLCPFGSFSSSRPASRWRACGGERAGPPTAAVVDGSEAGRADRSGDSGPGLSLVLPTLNRALLEGRPERFYQGLNVAIDSLRPEKWEGGQYGFVRDPVPTIFGFDTFRRVHEGIDVRPVGRDAGRGADGHGPGPSAPGAWRT